MVLAGLIALPTQSVHAAFAGKNGSIAYTDMLITDNGNGGPNVAILLKDISNTGSSERILDNNLTKFFSPRYSANGRQLTATGPLEVSGTSLANIYVMNADGTNPVNVTNIQSVDFPDRQNYAAAFSSFHPSGTKLTYATIWEEDDGNGGFIKVNRINTINADGSGQQQLTAPPAGTCDTYPVFSPDGNRIAFMRGQDNTTNAGIYTMNADGSDLHQIVALSTAGFNCAASDEIFYMGLTPSSFAVDGYQPSSLDWSPDGTHIAYSEGTKMSNGTVDTLLDSIYVTDLSGNKHLVRQVSGSFDESLIQSPPDSQPPELQLDSMVGVQYTPDGRLIFKTLQYSTRYIYSEGSTQWEPDQSSATMKSTIAMIKTDGSDLQKILDGGTVVGGLANYQLYVHMLPTVQPLTAPQLSLASTGQNQIQAYTLVTILLAIPVVGYFVKRRLSH